MAWSDALSGLVSALRTFHEEKNLRESDGECPTYRADFMAEALGWISAYAPGGKSRERLSIDCDGCSLSFRIQPLQPRLTRSHQLGKSLMYLWADGLTWWVAATDYHGLTEPKVTWTIRGVLTSAENEPQ